jgi:hypothetical protein
MGRVAPGDLIRSDLLNQLIAHIESLDARVASLETGGGLPDAPVITGHVPDGDVVAGTELRVIGRKFLVPTSQNTVTIDGRAFTAFLPGSNDGQLVLDVPADFPNLPRNVTLTVSNRNGQVSDTIRLRPGVLIPRGKLVVTDTTGVLGQALQIGQVATFAFRLDSQTDLAETYDVQPVFTSAVGATETAWRAGTTLLGGSSSVISPTDPVQVGARIVVPPGAQSVDFALSAASRLSSDPQMSVTTSVRHLVIGQAPEVSDPRTSFQLAAIGPASANSRNADLDGNRGVEIRFGNTGPVPVVVLPTVAGSYRYSATVEQPGGLWTVGALSPAQATEAAGNPRRLSLDVSCSAPGPAPERRFLVVRAVRIASDGSDDFSSFFRFPVQGFAV